MKTERQRRWSRLFETAEPSFNIVLVLISIVILHAMGLPLTTPMPSPTEAAFADLTAPKLKV